MFTVVRSLYGTDSAGDKAGEVFSVLISLMWSPQTVTNGVIKHTRVCRIDSSSNIWYRKASDVIGRRAGDKCIIDAK